MFKSKVSKSKMSFDVLNDDCWLAIINILEIRDQISLYEATKGISNRLNTCVIQNWRFQQCFYIDEASTETFLSMPEVLNIFLSSVSRNMRQLKLDHVKMEFLKRFVDFTFPNMKTLDYKLCISHLEDQSAAADECLRLIIELFPGLHSLKAHSGLNFKLLRNFTQLRKLELTPSLLECDGPYESDIEKNQLLEEVIVHYNWNWLSVENSIQILPKLHTVFFHIDNVTEWYDLFWGLKYPINICFNNGIRQYGFDSMMIIYGIRSWVDPYCHFNKKRMRKELIALRQMLQLGLMDLKKISKTELKKAERLNQFKLQYLSDIQLEKDFFKVCNRHITEEAPPPFTLFYHEKWGNELVIGVKAQISSVTIRIPDRIN